MEELQVGHAAAALPVPAAAAAAAAAALPAAAAVAAGRRRGKALGGVESFLIATSVIRRDLHPAV